MKDLVMVAHFCGDFDGKGNNRFNYLANLLVEKGFNVELITSDFMHNKKNKRCALPNDLPYKVTLIEEPNYKKNVSLKRIYSHIVMSQRLRKYLQHRKRPDIIYCAIPSLSISNIAAQYAKDNDVKFIVDIQDIWPEAFEMILNIPIVSSLLFYPMRRIANKIYAAADDIIAVSETYARRALSVNKKCDGYHSIFIGTELSKFDSFVKVNPHPKENRFITLVYIGTLGHSYDIKIVIEAIKILNEKGVNNIKFKVIGTGPLAKSFESYANSLGVDANFMGLLNYSEMVSELTDCDIAINPIVKKSAASIINKHADYAAAGLPVINTQENEEYRKLVEDYNMGLNCIPGNAKDVAKKIEYMIKNKDEMKKMAENSRLLAEEKFDRKKTYLEIVEIIKKK